MLDIKSIYKSLLNNHIKLMWRISWVIITFFYFIFSFLFVSIFSPEPLKSNFNTSLKTIPLNTYEFIILMFIVSILLSYIFEGTPKTNPKLKKHVDSHQKFFIEYCPSLPLFLITFGFFVSFISAISKILFLVQIGLIIFLFGMPLWVVMVIIKNDFESKISYAIYKANENVKKLNDPQQTKEFIRFINLTLNNINLKLGRKIKLNSSKLGTYQFETILRDYLPYYLKLAGTVELDSLKNHIETMSKSVSESDDIDFKIFTNELIQLSNEIIGFYKDNNLKFVRRSSTLNFFRDMNNVRNLVFVLSYLTFFLLILYYWHSGELTSKSLLELVLRK